MNWDRRTATGREELLIQARKHRILQDMEPDLFPDTPYASFKYLAEDCVLRSERLAEPAEGKKAVQDFLIREKRLYDGLVPIPLTVLVEAEDGDTLLRIRPWKADLGELVRVELNAEGLVCLIDRFEEQGHPYREMGSGMTLTPARKGKNQYEDDKNERIVIPGLYYDEMRLVFYLQDDVFEDMEDRYMDMAEWVGLIGRWKEINGKDPETLRSDIMKSEEKYTQGNLYYRRELEELVDDVLEKRDPYGRRMQAMVEDWINYNKDRYEMIRKC